MLKYILSTGIGVLLCSISLSQQLNIVAEPGETTFSDNILVATSTVITKDKKRFELPEQGQVVGDINAERKYSGTVKRHKLHGSWKSWYSNQNLCDSGTFFKGLPAGEWKHWDKDGQLVAIRHYNADKFLRIRNEFLRSNPKQVVFPLTTLYKKNRRKATRYMQAGYSFSFIDHHVQHLSLQQAVENNITPGYGYRPLFEECLHHGLYMNFYNDGHVKDSGYYKNGLRDGIWIHREATGSYMWGMYKNGMKQGDWKQYDTRGKLGTFIFYNKKGEEEWRKKIRE